MAEPLIVGNAARTAACAACFYFENAAREIEASISGIGSMSSAYASVRSDDGLCRLHDRYLQARSFCGKFSPR